MPVVKASASPFSNFDVVPTGFPKLDKLLGVGGIPTRKITEFYGSWSVGKSTLSFTIIKNAQGLGMDVLLADTEVSFGPDYAKALGVDLERLDLLQERFAENTLDEIEAWVEGHKDALVVLDSVGGLLPRAEAEKSAEGKTIGGQAKLVATFCRKIVPLLAINNVALLVVNHEFQDLMTSAMKSSGGAKLAYHKSISIRLKKSFNKQVTEKASGTRVGDFIEAEVKKNKLAATSGQKCDLLLLWGEGFSQQADVLEDLVQAGKIGKQGQFWYRIDPHEKLARGDGAMRELLKDPEFVSRLKLETPERT